MTRKPKRWFLIFSLVLPFWVVYVTRPLPLEKVARRLQYGQNETSIVMLLSNYDRLHAETFTRLKSTSEFPSSIIFQDAADLIAATITYGNRVGYMKIEGLTLYLDSEGKLVGYKYDRSS